MVSLSPDITERLPALLSARSVSADGEANGALYDVILSGIGFVMDISSETPYLRESQPVQKQQIDTSVEPGEQSLDGSWVRSQTSWHLGAGATFYEPGTRDDAGLPTRFRFRDSRGVDVWSRGQLSLLRRMDAVQTTSLTTAVCGARLPSGEDVWYSRLGDVVWRHHSGGPTSHGTAGSSLAGGRICAAGSVILVGAVDGVYSTPAAGTGYALISSAATGQVCQPYYVKSRVIISRGNVLHQVPLSGGALGSGTTLYTHPDAGWTWSGVTESPDAVLAAGYSGGVSSIYAFTLTEDSAASVPKLGQPFQVSELPPGEEVRAIQSYLGRYLGIGTTAGLRVGVLGAGGQVQYGPLLVETADPVVALGARDSYLYAAAGSSVIRVDLAESIDDGLRFPYAYDVELPVDHDISSLAFDGVSSRVVVSSDTYGVYAASDTHYVSSGWLESGQIRYGTTTPKTFRSVDITAATNATTSVDVAAVVDDTQLNLVTLSNGRQGAAISLSALPPQLGQAGYRLTLRGDTDTPVIQAAAMKALPVPPRQRLVQYPVLVVDRGRDAKGTPYGKDGFATTVLMALDTLESSGKVVSVKDLNRPEQFEATIEKIEFRRVAPRARGGRPNFGGVALVTVRTL